MKETPLWMWLAGAVALVAIGMTIEPGLTVAYVPWLVWLGLVVWIGWWVPGTIATTDRPFRDAGRRSVMGAVAVTLVSLPVVYVIATLQASVFGGEGFQLADPQVLLATTILLAPMAYIPLLAVRCGLLFGTSRRG